MCGAGEGAVTSHRAPHHTALWSGRLTAFAALHQDGRIYTWGSLDGGGRGAPVDTGYTTIFSTDHAFAALKQDGSISAWGGRGDSNVDYGGSGAPIDAGYVDVRLEP